MEMRLDYLLAQLMELQMVLTMEIGSVQLMETLWAHPTEMDWARLTENLKEMCLAYLSDE